jgi:uncharacterized repeat protein (TIGR01451 family)
MEAGFVCNPMEAAAMPNLKQLGRRTRFAAVFVMLIVLVNIAPHIVHAASPVQVTVTIQRFVELQNPDGGLFGQSHGNYYGYVKIDNGEGAATPTSSDGYQDSRNFAPVQQDNGDISPFWRFTATVDGSLSNIPISIQVKDDDTGVALSVDDVMDLNPKSCIRELHLNFNLQTGDWTDADNNVTDVGWSRGNGDTGCSIFGDGGETGEILYDIGFNRDDTAGDGIPDGVKRFGVRDINTGNPVTGAAPGWANPCRKTVADWYDWMVLAGPNGHSHQPRQQALTDLQAAFRYSPVAAVPACPYPNTATGTGVDLVLVQGNPTPEQATIDFTCPSGAYDAIRNASFPSGLRPYFHYTLFAHNQPSYPTPKNGCQGLLATVNSSSGLCCGGGGKDTLVTLGAWADPCVGPGPDKALETKPAGDDVADGNGTTISTGPDGICNTAATGDDVQIRTVGTGPNGGQVGRDRDQAHAFMHELGHSLGLGHGGGDGINYKPNYLSLMNYQFQGIGGVPTTTITNGTETNALEPGFRLDYSRFVLRTLDETKLAESLGVESPGGTGSAFGDLTIWTDAAKKLQTAPAAGFIDWDTDPSATEASDSNPVNVDVTGNGVCVSAGPDGKLATVPAGDDVYDGNTPPQQILAGPDNKCETSATTTASDGDDSNQFILLSYDDWDNLHYGGPLSAPGSGDVDHPDVPPITFPQAEAEARAMHLLLSPDLQLGLTVDRQDASPGDVLTYTATITNSGTGTATAVTLTNTAPDGSSVIRHLADIGQGATVTQTFAYTVPCQTTDLTKLVDNATVTSTNLLGVPEQNTANNAATASTTVHTPVLTLTKTATPSVNAGEAATYTLTYANIGSGAATGVTITDILPTETYYSIALDQGAGPRPASVVANADGTTTLTWNIGSLSGNSGPAQIAFTARPSLLVLAGTNKMDQATVSFQNANGCVYTPVTASATTTISEVPPGQNPLTLGYWRNHPEEWTTEILARIQATDTRFDANGDGMLSGAEIQATFSQPGGSVSTLQWQLLAVYFNLGTRRINADTLIASKTATSLGLHNVRDAALYAIATLNLSPTTNSARYVLATTVLDEINSNRSEMF